MRSLALMVAAILLAAIVGCEGRGAESRRSEVEVFAFTAEWCGPCQRAKPVLEKIRADGAAVRVVDIDAQRGIAQRFQIKQIPTFLVFVNGHQVTRTQDVSVARRAAESARR